MSSRGKGKGSVRTQDESEQLYDPRIANLALLWYFCRKSDLLKGNWRPLKIVSDRQVSGIQLYLTLHLVVWMSLLRRISSLRLYCAGPHLSSSWIKGQLNSTPTCRTTIKSGTGKGQVASTACLCGFYSIIGISPGCRKKGLIILV